MSGSPRWHGRTPEAFLEGLRPELADLEKWRLSLLDKRAQGGKWMLGVVVLGLLTGVVGLSEGVLGVFLGVLVLVIGMAVVYGVFFAGTAGEFQGRFKQEVVNRVVSAMEPGIRYQPKGHVEERWFRASGLFSHPDRYQGEDFFVGNIGKTDLFFSEIHAEDRRTRTDSDGNTETYYVTIFRGLLVVADFHKHFKSEVEVRPDGLEKLGAFGRSLQKLGGKVERMENPEFERLFVVRASDAVEARYILTPAMQERFVELAGKFSKEVRAAFRDSLVYVAIPKQADWFEGDLKCRVDDLGQFRELVFQLSACFGLVEDLDLNTRIWTKD
ncbi:MAG: DUF3137 domain-containing protein [Verrucomicrobiota bacterium]